MTRYLVFILFFLWSLCLKAQLPSLDGNENDTITSFKTTKENLEHLDVVEKKNTESTTSKEKKYQYLTWFMECNYLLIPASLTSGAEVHFEFINRVKKKTAVKPTVGMGGFYFQHLYKQYNYDDFKGDVFARRYGGHFTIGARVVHRLGGICLRAGYNLMNIQYKFNNFQDIQVANTPPTNNRLLHRMQFEVVGFKSFSKKKPGVGILAGVKYLLEPIQKNSDLLIVKIGIAF